MILIKLQLNGIQKLGEIINQLKIGIGEKIFWCWVVGLSKMAYV